MHLACPYDDITVIVLTLNHLIRQFVQHIVSYLGAISPSKAPKAPYRESWEAEPGFSRFRIHYFRSERRALTSDSRFAQTPRIPHICDNTPVLHETTPVLRGDSGVPGPEAAEFYNRIVKIVTGMV